MKKVTKFVSELPTDKHTKSVDGMYKILCFLNIRNTITIIYTF